MYVRNLRLKPRKRCTGSNLVDQGRDAVRGRPKPERPTPKPPKSEGQEAAPKNCGVSAAKLPGQSRAPILADRHTGNVGTTRDRPRTGPPGRERGQARRRLTVSWWGGGPVVLRAGGATRKSHELSELHRRRSADAEGVVTDQCSRICPRA